MLKTIPPILPPDLLWVLAAMGHGDRLAVVNANYPAYSWHDRVIALPGVTLVDAITAILRLMPLDDITGGPVLRMVPDGDPGHMAEVHQDVQEVANAAEARPVGSQPVARAAFFDLAKSSFAAVATTDNRPFGCFMLTKGVIRAT